ncbi:MAG: bifunctional pyr operon transcriptional regulator/uracil phosphoribosyltransferase PyrR [Propionibacteriaceae bacterium]|nr:bifunctional pyr operon transcriptional regulator/uracil phosphoribosyltransferase PyrR [Propionibacteriaceae bacterium]
MERRIADAAEISRMFTRMAHELLELNHGPNQLVVLGIPTRGCAVASRLAEEIKKIEKVDVPVGTLDITMYRDDLRRHPTREARRSDIPVDVNERVVVLADDVLYSGRTVASAFDALKDLGRPAAIRLVELVDRGHHQLPIAADIVGKTVQTAADEHVRVRLHETDGYDAIEIGRN